MQTRPPFPDRLSRWIAAVLAFGLGLWAIPAAAAPAIIPAPKSMTVRAHADPVRIADGTPIVVAADDAEALQVAGYLHDLAARARGLDLPVRSGAGARPGETAIVLARRGRRRGSEEAYDLSVSPGRIAVTAAAAPGLFYGATTLWQLLTPDAAQGAVAVPQLCIHDAPRFRWRGLLLDSARHYQSPAFIEQLIDWMALHKLNVLHWHLTDDQGWRLQIKAWPKLTEVGAWRVPAGEAAAHDIDPATGKPRLYGGFYTQDQARAIVAYAAARHVAIVPEIDMPGHALAAILSYPELGSDGPGDPAIESDWGVFPYIYNVDDHTFAVLDEVLGEVMAVFPGRYIHIGGDEARKEQWKASPQIRAKMRALGIRREEALQSYFMRRIEAFVNAHGRRVVGWDEILKGGLPPTATVMSWNGIDGATAAARAGHDAILSPSPGLYLDHRQSDLADQPPGRADVTGLRDVYAFEPVPPHLTPRQRRHILGLQGNLWTEHVRTEDRVQAMAFPREAAVAEVGWSPRTRRDWNDFAARLPAMFGRYRALGLKADDAALEVRVDDHFNAADNQVAVALSTEIGQGEIRYTTDGSDPTAASPAYDLPLTLALPTTLKAAAFRDAEAISPIAERRFDPLSVRHRVSQDLALCTDKVGLNLEADWPIDGPRPIFLVDIMNPCWMYKAADLTGITALQVAVGRIPFNFQLGKDRAKIVLRPPATPDGELEVRADGCEGAPIAVLPLAPAAGRPGLTTLTGALPPASGAHDLCFTFTARRLDPMWVIESVQLVPAGT
ncbi:MAG TPA: family 20 glycosylhydrolase [Caulobacteraceae bacterium]|jgi:hexosaminidase|nr:family 20 glycosylhydrolase [Caulobacteraceae bacterium]